MRGCNKCVYHTSGECRQLKCNFTTIEDVRNKAIDDFMKKSEYLLCENLIYQEMEEIAEQLKAGEREDGNL